MSTEPAPIASPEPIPPTTNTPEAAPSLISTPEVAKPEGEAPKPAEPAAEFVPLTVEAIKLPDGFTVAEPIMDEFLTLANEAKLSPEFAQKLVDLQIKANTEAATVSAAAGTETWNKLQETWQTETKADPVIGGAALEGNLANIQKLITKLMPDKVSEVNAAFTMTGAGNNPVLVKLVALAAKELTEGGPVSGDPPSQSASVAEKMYPSMKSGG